MLCTTEPVPTCQVLHWFSVYNLSISDQATKFCDENLADKTNVVDKMDMMWFGVAQV